MAEPAGRIPRPRLELSLAEARTRFVQLARLASLTGQTTVVTDAGRPLAAIVPVDGRAGPGPGGGAVAGRAGPGGGAAPARAGPGDGGAGGRAAPDRGDVAGPAGPDAGASAVAAGWVRRIETLRAEFLRQHGVLERALEDAWRELDRLRPPGSDDAVDALRLRHSDVRRSP